MKRQIVLVILLALLVGVTVQAQEAYWPTEGWQTSTPEAQGIDSAKLAEALVAIRQQDVDIHSLMVVRNGSMVVDAYFYPYDGQTVHELASVTKSVITTLIGIAADQGRLSLDDPMLSFFPDRTIANRDAWKESITVRHLASMSSGLDCTSEGDEATLQEMRVTDDWVQFTLDRPVLWEPGTHFVYCSPAIHLLSPILQQATGMTALDFARQYLFAPLGIQNVIWLTDPQGYTRGSEGVYLHPHDMAKLGYLWLNNGVWDGEQIVSREWVEDSIRPLMDVGEGEYYGYGWWVYPTGEPQSFNAIGRGGQRIAVIPAWNIMVVTTGGGFDFDEIVPLLVETLSDLSKARPANPEGVGQLEQALITITQPPQIESPSPLPQIASEVSNQTFVFESNPLGMENLSLEFNDTSEATLHITLSGSETSWPVALDGAYRLFPGNYDLPMGLRGEWVDEQTFVLEYDAIANNDHILIQMRFDGDRVVIVSQETAHDATVTFEGSIQHP